MRCSCSGGESEQAEPLEQTERSLHEHVASDLLGVYKRLFSPLLHGVGISQCKYLPTCSEYGYVAVVRHGWLRGSWMALRRVARCGPWSGGGHDPVP